MAQKSHPAVDLAAYAALRVLIATLQALPLEVCDRGAAVLAWFFTTLLPIRRRLVDGNLQTAFPEQTARERQLTARRMWHHLFLMVAEIAHTPRKIHRTTWRKRCRLDDNDERVIVSTLLHDGPKVIISAHYGNFELGGYMLGLFGFPTHTVARTIDNPYVNRYVNDFRGRTGQYMLPKQGSREVIEQVMEAGGALTLLGDQAAGRKGCWINFFGRPASTHKAVSLFTLTYEAPTVVIGVRRLGKPLQYETEAIAFVDPRASDFQLGTTTLLTEWFTRGLEEIIRKAPEQYWWVHNRWKGEPPTRRKKKAA